MDKSLITIKKLEKEDNKIKVTAVIENIGDVIWESNVYTFRGHYISHTKFYSHDIFCEDCYITETVNPGEEIEKTIIIRNPDPENMQLSQFFHP